MRRGRYVPTFGAACRAKCAETADVSLDVGISASHAEVAGKAYGVALHAAPSWCAVSHASLHAHRSWQAHRLRHVGRRLAVYLRQHAARLQVEVEVGRGIRLHVVYSSAQPPLNNVGHCDVERQQLYVFEVSAHVPLQAQRASRIEVQNLLLLASREVEGAASQNLLHVLRSQRQVEVHVQASESLRECAPGYLSAYAQFRERRLQREVGERDALVIDLHLAAQFVDGHSAVQFVQRGVFDVQRSALRVAVSQWRDAQVRVRKYNLVSIERSAGTLREGAPRFEARDVVLVIPFCAKRVGGGAFTVVGERRWRAAPLPFSIAAARSVGDVCTCDVHALYGVCSASRVEVSVLHLSAWDVHCYPHLPAPCDDAVRTRLDAWGSGGECHARLHVAQPQAANAHKPGLRCRRVRKCRV